MGRAIPGLISKQIYLRALDEHDVDEAYVRWLNEPEVLENIVSGNFPQGYDAIRAFIGSMRPPHAASFAVCLNGPEQHVGNVALRHIDWVNRTAEVGILIGEATARGRGLATEAVDLISRYAFHRLRLRRLWTGTTNPKAAKLFLGLGWTHEGTLRHHVLVGGEWRDQLLYGVMEHEFSPRGGA